MDDKAIILTSSSSIRRIMKQNISLDQLNSLSPKAKERLRKWWKPKISDKVNGEGFEDGVLLQVYFEDYLRSGWNFQQLLEDEPSLLPLLSVGQMIEFLSGHSEIYLNAIIYDDLEKAHLMADRLWRRVKDVLEQDA